MYGIGVEGIDLLPGERLHKLKVAYMLKDDKLR